MGYDVVIATKFAFGFLEEKKKDGNLHELFAPGILDEFYKYAKKAVVHEALGLKGPIYLDKDE
jgi:hypothetical protein